MGEKFSKKKDLADFVTKYSGMNVRENDVKPIIKMGFADEDLNPTLPKNLISLEKLIGLGKKEEEIRKYFTSKISSKPTNYTIDAAKMLKIIDENGNLIDIDTKKKEIESNVIEKLKPSLPDPITNQTQLTIQQQIIKLLVDSFEKIDEETDDLKKRIILGRIEEGSKIPPVVEPGKPQSRLCPNCGKPLKDHTPEELAECKKATKPEPPVITEEIVLEFCKEVLTDQKLIREELEQKFVENTKFGLGTQHVWFPMITKFMMNGQISLTL